MGCNCGSRGQILNKAAQALRQGQVRQAAVRTGTVVRSMGTDAARATQQAALRARQAMSRRGR